MNEELMEYRADHMTLEELEKITAETKFYSEVLKKLLSRGSKIIVGPRGVGKTHHMRIAYKQAISNKNKPLPIYVSFSKYLRLEPLKNSSSIAVQYFHCWVLSKILLATRDSLNDLKLNIDNFINEASLQWEDIELFCEQIEKQQIRDWHNHLLDIISVNFTSKVIDLAIFTSKRKHSILLCDDAALVLTKDYMIEFFDIFRSLKSAKISPKASVYPNTEFGPRFHVGQDAENVPCWPSIADEEYVSLFEDIYEKRFLTPLKDEVKKCFMYAAFGVPRAFINLINQFNLSANTNIQSSVNAVLSEQSSLIIDEFKSLSNKQPQYKNYVTSGYKIFNKIVSEIAESNKKSLENNEQQFFLGILKENKKSTKDLEIIIRLLEETGLLHKYTEVKHGKNTDESPRIYKRYIPHFTLLIKEGAYQVGRAGYVTNFSQNITLPKAKHPLRKSSFAEFISPQELSELSLDLPSCSSCGNARSSESQRFCMHCGAELINKSTFESLTQEKVDSLPITNWLKKRIREETRIETIGDIVFSTNPGQELMKAKGIGKVKASKVIEQATQLMDEYLS
ncbi:hypothetical protein [Shewanella frigidimarina]|uniref:ORC-CDC6 family AAA ATPase n=1 Tax=Shewanella frigidimarina TaxID=56812 RepID=UPI003D7B75FC